MAEHPKSPRDRPDEKIPSHREEIRRATSTTRCPSSSARPADVRDGLKPVHRRVLYGMWSREPRGRPYKSPPHRRHVMGKYHPHGDSAIYDTIVRMAQPFSLRETLVTGRATSVPWTATPPRRCVTRRSASRASPRPHRRRHRQGDGRLDAHLHGSLQNRRPAVRVPEPPRDGSEGIASHGHEIPPHNLAERATRRSRSRRTKTDLARS